MKIVIVGDFPETAKESIRQSFPEAWHVRVVRPSEAERELGDAEVLIPEHIRVDAALLTKAPKLRLVQTGAGYDNVDLAACTRAGVLACCAAGINAGAVAEHVMALILCWYKNIIKLDGCMKAHGDASALCYTGAELSGKTIGIVGLGHVGKALAGLCRAFGMRVLAYSRSPLTVDGAEARDWESLCRESDIISLHVPLSESTRHMIDAEALAAMKPDALLINTARGAVVDEEALIRALRRGEIGGACLDVFEDEPLAVDHPLRDLRNVILTPHTAGYPDGPRYHRKRYAFFAENIEKVMRDETPEGCLNHVGGR